MKNFALELVCFSAAWLLMELAFSVRTDATMSIWAGARLWRAVLILLAFNVYAIPWKFLR